ncbi:MAG: hypothetical protein HY303_20460, partial [Candidatus Wallbacteria bacterium]|nr:hypothetical protein [Candidatus Wallbacteria bacterium]
LQQLAEALLGNGERGLADSLLSAALGRLWIERACLERPELPAGRRDELEARVAGRVAHASRIAASRCARPARVLDALDRLPGGDRFVSSLAVEYLASELPGELKDLLLPLLEASGASRFASRSRCWLDTTALGIPRVMALLGETDAYCSQA